MVGGGAGEKGALAIGEDSPAVAVAAVAVGAAAVGAVSQRRFVGTGGCGQDGHKQDEEEDAHPVNTTFCYTEIQGKHRIFSNTLSRSWSRTRNTWKRPERWETGPSCATKYPNLKFLSRIFVFSNFIFSTFNFA